MVERALDEALAALKARAYPHMLECERRFVDEFPSRVRVEHLAGVRNLLRNYRHAVPDADTLVRWLEQ